MNVELELRSNSIPFFANTWIVSRKFMKINRDKNLIVNYIFVFGILLLFLNDQIFKFQYSNFVTGKLSDICGIIIFPMLITYVFPKLRENSIFVAAAIFAFWKSEYSQGLINLYNEYSFIKTSRIIDYSDLFVFILLPIPYYLIKKSEILERIKINRINPKLILFPSIFILLAESPPPSHYYTMNNGNLKCYKCNITVNYNKDYILKKLKNNGIEFDSITPIHYRSIIDSTSGAKKYFKKELVIDNDTLKNIDLTIFPIRDNKTQIYFNGMDVSQNLQADNKLEMKLRKYYKKLIFNEIKQTL